MYAQSGASSIVLEIGRDEGEAFEETFIVWTFQYGPAGRHITHRMVWDNVGDTHGWDQFIEALVEPQNGAEHDAEHRERSEQQERSEHRNTTRLEFVNRFRHMEMSVSISNNELCFRQASMEWGDGSAMFTVPMDPSMVPLFKELKGVCNRYQAEQQ